MVTQEQILEALKKVVSPDLIREVKIAGGTVNLAVAPSAPIEPIRSAVSRIPGVMVVNVATGDRPGPSAAPRHVVAVASGKGGVGKTTVSVNVAVALARDGARVGLMDADIYGPNVPLMMGVDQLPAMKDEKIVPAENFGVKVMSMGFLMKPGDAVIWRGPMLHGAVNKFLKEVAWGDLDYLIVDLPPGCLTADTLVSTDRGPVPIHQVKEGMKVYSFDGNVARAGKSGWKMKAQLVTRRVISMIPQGRARIYELKTATRTIKGTEDHPLLVLRRKKRKNSRYHHYGLEWEKLACLQPDDRILVVKKLPQEQHAPLHLPELNLRGMKPIDVPEYVSTDLMRLFGYFLGDGSVRLANGKYWGVWFSEPVAGKYRNAYIRLLRDLFGLRHIHETPEKFSALSAPVAELFDRLGFRKGALEKTIPPWVFTQPASLKMALIEGYCDADGHWRSAKIGHRRPGWMCFESPNEQLIGGLRALCMEVGLKAGNKCSRTRDIKVPSTGQVLRRQFWSFEANKTAKTDRYGAGFIRGKVGKGFLSEWIGFEKIKQLKEIGEEEVFDLHVEGEHNFVADGFIVHNTGDVQLSLAQVISMSGALVVTTPQDVALQDVQRAVSMFEKVKVPVLGLVENMSTFICPHCSKATEIFDHGGGARAAEVFKVPFLGEIPLVTEVRAGSDSGHPVVLTHPDSPAAQALTQVARKLAGQLSIRAAQGGEPVQTAWKL